MDWLDYLQKSQEARELELANCKKDPWRFLTHWCYTIDTGDEDNSEKLFPNREHLFITTKFWMLYPTLLVPKSRQLSMTWLMCGLYLWQSFFFKHRLTFVQSKKESDANELILRTMQMYNSLPWWMREFNPAQSIYCYMEFKNSGSRIMGIPQGADHIRGYQPSGVFNDEVVFQIDVDKVVAAIRPALRSGGKLTMVSSAGPGFFAQAVLDSL